MSSSQKQLQKLETTSITLVADAKRARRCTEIFPKVKDYYLLGIEPFLKSHPDLLSLSGKGEKRVEKVQDVLKGADFYCRKATEYFSFFGVDFADISKSAPIKVENIDPKMGPFLYSSVQLLYVMLWEILAGFLRPLEKLFHRRLCDARLFPEKYSLFPYSGKGEDVELEFLSSIKGSSPLFRVGEAFPYELRVVWQASPYFRKCFDEGLKKTVGPPRAAEEEQGKESGDKSRELVDDMIRLFVIRNNACHIGRAIALQETSEDRMYSLLYNLSTLLPRIQDSFIGVLGGFEELAKTQAA